AARADRQGRDEGLSALDLPDGGQGAVSQHEGGDRPSPPDGRIRDRSDPARRAETGAQLDPRRHRWLTPVLHGTALPQYLRRRARLPLPPGMGQPAGHGKSRRDDGASRDDLGGAGVTFGARLTTPSPSRSKSPRAASRARPEQMAP